MIKTLIKKLPEQDLKRLLYALEHDFSQHVIIDTSQFIGVNIIPSAQFRILESYGAWSFGNIHQGNFRPLFLPSPFPDKEKELLKLKKRNLIEN